MTIGESIRYHRMKNRMTQAKLGDGTGNSSTGRRFWKCVNRTTPGDRIMPASRRMLFHQKPYRQRDLSNEDGWNAQGEFQMHCLVPEGVHSGQSADAPAQGSGHHQGGFRDAPEIFLRFPLVREHKEEGSRID